MRDTVDEPITVAEDASAWMTEAYNLDHRAALAGEEAVPGGILQYLPTTPGDELTLEVNGKSYVISTVVDQDGQLVNVMNLANSLSLEGAMLERVEVEAYDPSDLILVRDSAPLEETDMLVDMGEGVHEVPDDDQSGLTRLEASEEASQDAETSAASSTVKRRKLKKARVRNKDVMRLPFSYSGQTFSVQAQKLILNVYDFFKRTQRDPYALKKAGGTLEQAAKVLNVTSSVVGKVQNRFKAHGRIVVSAPNRIKVKRILDRVDEEKEAVIRSIVQELTLNKISPTIAVVMAKALEQEAFKGSSTSFRRVLRRMRFKFEKSGNKVTLVDPNNEEP